MSKIEVSRHLAVETVDGSKLGYAFAAAVVLMLMIGVLTLAYFRILSKRVHYQ